jgi:hypothetical protein
MRLIETIWPKIQQLAWTTPESARRCESGSAYAPAIAEAFMRTVLANAFLITVKRSRFKALSQRVAGGWVPEFI